MLHLRYGQRLFGEGEFEEAMVHFGMVRFSNPVVLLRLFPSLSPQSLLEPLLPTISGASAIRYHKYCIVLLCLVWYRKTSTVKVNSLGQGLS